MTAAIQAGAGAPQRQIDGGWWLSATEDARTGFVGGAADCTNAYARLPTLDGPIAAMTKALTAFYVASTERARARVSPAEFIFALDSLGRPHGTDEGVYDGDFWWQLPAQREGFVLGFTACQKKYLGTTVAASPESLVNWMTRWYGIDDKDPGVIIKARASVKLGTVLLKAEQALDGAGGR